MSKPKRFLKFFAWLVAAIVAGMATVAAGVYLYLSPKLPPVDSLQEIQLQIPLRVFSKDGVLIGEFGEKKRTPVTYAQVPPDFVHAILAAEDDKFLEHHGVDLTGLLRAASELASTGSIRSGGSTITMQVAKNYFLTRERTFTRKFTEILLALQIDQELSKQEILELYVNKIYLGNRAYGIGAAAQVYYGKSIEELNLAQLAMIAGLPKAPSSYNPLVNPERALERRNWILARMYKLGFIDASALKQATAAPVTASLHDNSLELAAPWVAEMARAQIVRRFGSDAYTNGYRVTTTIDGKLQEKANEAALAGLLAYDKRHGYRGPEKRLPVADGASVENGQLPLGEWQATLADIQTIGEQQAAAVISVAKRSINALLANGDTVAVAWDAGLSDARAPISVDSLGKPPESAADLFAVGDIIRLQQVEEKWQLGQIPQAETALISLRPDDGAILAMVGGLDFRQNKFNRVTQAKRQPGSNFKPFIYAAALQHGFTAASIFNDAPVVFEDDRLEATWRPVNASGRFYGPTRLRKALYLSRNLVSIRLLRSVGVSEAVDYVTRFGFKSADLPKDLSLALGTLSISPLELVRGYAALANGGFLVKPYVIEEIQDIDGEVLYTANPAVACADCSDRKEQEASSADKSDADSIVMAKRIMEPRVHYLINSMLKDVVQRGTATKARSLGRNDIAGKTGTTNGPTDAWFSGYNRDVVTTTWLGFDQNQPLGRREYGGTAALPIWMDYMALALKDSPVRDWKQPDGMTMVRIDPASGLLAQPSQDDAIFEVFRSEYAPTEYADPGNGGGQGNSTPSEELLEDDLF
jgi:penicillin-binding protein 1A